MSRNFLEPHPVHNFIGHVAKVSHALGWQAGVGGRETAGAIISYLAQHPEKLDAFMQDGVFGWGDEWITGGCLTYHAADGKVWHPADARDAREGLCKSCKRRLDVCTCSDLAAAGVVPGEG